MSAALYRYTARTAAGELVRGSMEAPDADDRAGQPAHARAVRHRGRARERAGAHARPADRASARPRRRALLAFFRSFATLIRAGVPMRRALEVAIERGADRVLRESLRSVLADIEQGSALSDALAKRPQAPSRRCTSR